MTTSALSGSAALTPASPWAVVPPLGCAQLNVAEPILPVPVTVTVEAEVVGRTTTP